jgi:Tfp pilus tip-associated adhesin PilY1
MSQEKTRQPYEPTDDKEKSELKRQLQEAQSYSRSLKEELSQKQLKQTEQSYTRGQDYTKDKYLDAGLKVVEYGFKLVSNKTRGALIGAVLGGGSVLSTIMQTHRAVSLNSENAGLYFLSILVFLAGGAGLGALFGYVIGGAFEEPSQKV